MRIEPHKRWRLFALAVLALATLGGGCTFDRSGLADKVECLDRNDCAGGESCIDGRCRPGVDSRERDAYDGPPPRDTSTEDVEPADAGSDLRDLGDDGPSSDCDTLNACGGCGVLQGTPGTACGPCDDGIWTCSANNSAVSCVGASSLNACGGCGSLEGEPDTACGPCDDGIWTCSVDDRSVTCEGASEPNSCGGCESLAVEPGVACGRCNLDQFACIDDNETTCDGDTRVNDCGGCTVLDDPPGTVCGPCDLDVFVCEEGDESTRCGGDTYGNRCDGCDELDGEPGEACSCDGAGDANWVCDGHESVACTDDNDTADQAIDLGSGDEQAIIQWTAWIDSASDRDWSTATVVEDLEDRSITVSAILTRVDDDFTSEITPVNYRLCTFYRYNDERGANLGQYSCGYNDDAAIWDASQDCITPNCLHVEPFDDAVDLMGCCDSDYFGYTDQAGRFFRGWIATVTGIDKNNGGNPDDRGRAFVHVAPTVTVSPSSPGCDEYDVELRF